MHRVLPSSVSGPPVQVIQPGTGALLSRRQYAALWTFLVLLHALSSAFLLCSARLYWLMENPYLDYFAGLLAPERDRHFRTVGTILGLLGAIHTLQLLSHVGASLFTRQVRVRPITTKSAIETCLKVTGNILPQHGYLRAWRNCGLGARSSCSQHELDQTERSSEYNTRLFALRKTMEIATQIPNGYLYSTLVARSWINHVKVALIVANCWSGFVLHQMLLKSEPASSQVAPSFSKSQTPIRFSAIVVDALLATSAAIVLPSAIILPYALQFDFMDLCFPDAMLYGDTAFPNLVLENRAFFFMSWANAAMKMVPHLSVFWCLQGIASMLQDSSESDTLPMTTRTLPEFAMIRSKMNRSVTASFGVISQAWERIQISAQIFYRVHHVIIPMLLLVTGGIVLGLHLSAQYGNQPGDVLENLCMQRMYPWFASNFTCAVVRYNCYKAGVASPSSEVLNWFERDAVRKIVFMHCSALIMPSIIREFPSLMGLELWNSTLVEWGQETAVSAVLHPRMLFVSFVYVNLTGIPPGILQSPLPEQLTDLEFIHTNLTIIPETVVKPWNGIEIMYIEHSHINVFPTALMQLPALSELSLIDNKLETVPEDAFVNGASTYFYSLALSKNLLRTLPQARSQNFKVSYLALEFTLLTEIPAWVTTNVEDAVSLGGSLLCQSNRTVGFTEIIQCGRDENAWDPLGDERYPTKLIEPFRSLEA